MAEAAAVLTTDAFEGSLLSLSALEQARRIREGTLTSEALVSFYLERIARLDGRYSSFVSVFAERALAEARAKDRMRRDRPLPPFHGVPLGVKDLHPMRGAFVKMGSRAYKWLWSPVDDVTVRTLRRAGFVLVGKTSTSELGMLPIVETDIHPPTRNPWNPEFTAGGSSGGAGAAVAAGLLPFAPGSDGAGSVRIPASLNGLVGFKPSRGLIPNPHANIDPFSMVSVGPLARSVEDAAALLDVLVGNAPASPDSFLSASASPLPRLSLGFIVRPPVGEVAPSVAAALVEAVETLRQQGHRVAELEGPRGDVTEFMPVYQRLLSSIPVFFESRLQPVTRWFRAEGRRRAKSEVERAFHELCARANAAFGKGDLVITPTIPVNPLRVGSLQGLAPEELFRGAAPLGVFTAPCNLTGAPAATVPWALDENGVPIGIQIIGRPGDDQRVMALARELEAARPRSFGVAPACL